MNETAKRAEMRNLFDKDFLSRFGGVRISLCTSQLQAFQSKLRLEPPVKYDTVRQIVGGNERVWMTIAYQPASTCPVGLMRKFDKVLPCVAEQ